LRDDIRQLRREPSRRGSARRSIFNSASRRGR
jgi:hypothetical protein